ncbi:uncharacterized protein LOC108735653 isoform X2 [Agrilus planipennis]|uniref:Uncharacterized protein LOC108735653 isoform X2 n=1 Tax=Agrilus planipennis TaxID=224129 RepID=A0A7F5QZ13_AGRPL|nr:uncharacterized protein LOC108735653 isoform X2 [Agrilus planipennis]
MRKLVMFCMCSLFAIIQTTDVLDTSHVLLERQKRFLVYRPGVNWIQLVVGIGIPADVDDHSITWGASMKAFYLLPDNSSYYDNPTIDYARRRKRATSRWDLYKSIIYFVERSGLGDGKACLLRAICELAEIPLEQTSGLFAEILHALLTPSSTPEEIQEYGDLEYHAAEKLGRSTGNCDSLYSECRHSLISKFTKLFSYIK